MPAKIVAKAIAAAEDDQVHFLGVLFDVARQGLRVGGIGIDQFQPEFTQALADHRRLFLALP